MKYQYKNSDYLKNNPTWHSEDSPWKAQQILKMFKRNDLQAHTIAEVGCGAGEILNQLYHHMKLDTIFSGYEISPDAFEMAIKKKKDRLSIYNTDIFKEDINVDVLLTMDVIEHVEDYFDFVRKAKSKAIYKVYHIPLDMTVLNVLRVTPIIFARNHVGHIHYFNKETALATLQDAGYEIIDFFYTPGMLETGEKKLKTKILNPFRKILFNLNQDLAVRLIGGYSLMVLSK